MNPTRTPERPAAAAAVVDPPAAESLNESKAAAARAEPSPLIASAGTGEPLMLNISPEEGMRYYAAILGHEPTLDPEAPDLLPGMSEDGGGSGARAWADDMSRALREEIRRKLQLTLKRRPTWRELMDAMALAAGRRIDEARRRLQNRNAA